MLEGRELSFGIPKREVKVDPYAGQALLIMHPEPEGKGQAYRFELTKLAVEQLNLAREDNKDEKVVSFSFTDEGILIANTTSMRDALPADSIYNVSMDGKFSNKKAHDYITNKIELNNKIINIFTLEFDTDDENSADFPVAKLALNPTDTIESMEANINAGGAVETAEEITDITEETVSAETSDIPEINAFEAERGE